MGGDIWAMDDELYTPGFPLQYTNHLRCHVNINAVQDATISFSVEQLDIEYAHNCIYDWLNVR